MEKTLCTKCGAEAKETDKWCRQCGANLFFNSISIKSGIHKFENTVEMNILKIIMKDLQPLFPDETFRIEKTCESYTTLFFDEHALCRLEYGSYHTIQIIMPNKMSEKYVNNPLFTFNNYHKPTQAFFMSYLTDNDLSKYNDILIEACNNILFIIEKNKSHKSH